MARLCFLILFAVVICLPLDAAPTCLVGKGCMHSNHTHGAGLSFCEQGRVNCCASGVQALVPAEWAQERVPQRMLFVALRAYSFYPSPTFPPDTTPD